MKPRTHNEECMKIQAVPETQAKLWLHIKKNPLQAKIITIITKSSTLV